LIARPTLVAFALFSVVYHRNDFFWPLVMTTNEAVRTLPIGVALLREEGTGARWHIIMAGFALSRSPRSSDRGTCRCSMKMSC
jgi:sn-glycerol 3-phosphate transport system permease protein